MAGEIPYGIASVSNRTYNFSGRPHSHAPASSSHLAAVAVENSSRIHYQDSQSRNGRQFPNGPFVMQPELIEIADRDGRYAWEAFEFVMDALGHAQRMFGKDQPREGGPVADDHHVTGRELLEGVCDLARREFGLMAPVVFECWGIRRTGDIGDIVFVLIDSGVLSKTESDRREDFEDVFELETALTEGYRLLDESTVEWGR